MKVHINFAPVVDVNNNAHNPVINDRSFGQNAYQVAHNGIMFMRGLHDTGIIACAKNFPGHGNTTCDSHQASTLFWYSKDIPTIIVAYEDDYDAQQAAAKVIIGKHTARGMMPV